MRDTDDLYSPEEKYFDYRNKLHLITPPTLVVVGEKDWICPLGAFARNLPTYTNAPWQTC
jgi:pimeloyl-ACP methyl ester carboxylesterase